jgi:acyl-CoA dehydrogenase
MSAPSSLPDTQPIRAFLEERHVAFARQASAWAAQLHKRPVPQEDAAARQEARALLDMMGKERLFEPIKAQDWRSCCLAREALAAVSPLADAVFALQALSSLPILRAGSPRQRELYALPAIAGRSMGAFAMTERQAGSDLGALATTATREGDAYVLDGLKTYISNAGIADFYVVFASTDLGARNKGITCFVVPAKSEGLRFVGPQILSAPHPLGEIQFDHCRIAAENRVGEEGKGFGIGLGTLDRLRATVGAAACGMAARALDEALRHARTRHQFGKPLAEFQLVQEKLARMATEMTAARLLVYRAAWEADQGAERVTMEAAMAKSHATEVAQRVVDEAVQVLGGAGVMASHPVDRLYRAVRALRIYEGTTEIQRLVIAGHLLRDETAKAGAS